MGTAPRFATGSLNSTGAHKITLRRRELADLASPAPFVLETHGGTGMVWSDVYRDLPGAVCELHAGRAEELARQRPAWLVFEGRAEVLLQAGLWAHAPVDLLDVDPFGDPFPVLEAFFSKPRIYASRMGIAVNDGLRNAAKLGLLWKYKSAVGAVAADYGSHDAFTRYAEIASETVRRLAKRAGYRVASWAAYHCGKKDNLTHYGGVLEQERVP